MERERRRRTMGDDRCLCVMSKWLQKKMEGEKRGMRRERERGEWDGTVTE